MVYWINRGVCTDIIKICIDFFSYCWYYRTRQAEGIVCQMTIIWVLPFVGRLKWESGENPER